MAVSKSKTINMEESASLFDLILSTQSILQRCVNIEEYSKLKDRLKNISDKNKKNETVISVIGSFSRGKSSLINALLRADIVPTSSLPATAVYTRISYGQNSRADLFFHEKNRERFSVEEAKSFVATKTDLVKSLNQIQITHPSLFLKSGVVLLDTPGIGSVYPEHKAVTLRCLEESDIAIFVMGSEPLLGQIECAFIREISTYFNHIFFVQTKIDLHTDWKERLEFNQSVLENIDGVAAPKIYPVSSQKLHDYQSLKNVADLKASRFTKFETDLISFIKKNKKQVVKRKVLLTLEKTGDQIYFHLEKAARMDTETIAKHMDNISAQRKTINVTEEQSKDLKKKLLSIFAECKKNVKINTSKINDELHRKYDLFIESTAVTDLRIKSADFLLQEIKNTQDRLLEDVFEFTQSTTNNANQLLRTFTDDSFFLSPINITFFRITSADMSSVKEVADTVKSKDFNLGTAVVGGVLGFFVGGFLGAAVGSAIGGAVGNETKVDIAATKKSYLQAGRKSIDKHMLLLTSQVDSQVISCFNDSQSAAEKHIDKIFKKQQHEIEEQIKLLNIEIEKTKKKIEINKADLSIIAEVKRHASSLE